MKRAVYVIVSLAVFPVAALELGEPFSDGAVLQRGKNVPIWGFAEPCESVRVSFDGQTRDTMSDANGYWRVDLLPMEASSEGRVLDVSSDSARVSVVDVLVGEVWLCSGQSNMEVPLCNTHLHFSDMKGALRGMMTNKSLVRYLGPHPRTTSPVALRRAAVHSKWKKCVPENLQEGCFSAVGLYFALEIHSALGVPVGIVGTYWGGTPIIAWTPECGYEAVSCVKDYARRAFASETARYNKPASIFNAMVAPYAPMSLRGVLWYQGESDAGKGESYRHWLEAFYKGWSKWFEDERLRLRIVQLAPAGNVRACIPIMVGQASFARETPNVELAVVCDRGAVGDFHPVDKETVGMRLAALALRHDYGFATVKADAPELSSWALEGSSVVLSFKNVERWMLYNEDWSNDNYFEISGTDGIWHDATIMNMSVKVRAPYKSTGLLDGREIAISSPLVACPRKVRYMYKPPCRANLFNEVGIPLGPFHIDISQLPETK